MSKRRTSKRGNGSGSLFKRTERGAWIAAWYDHTGRRKTKSTGTTDRAAADRILRQWVADAALRREGVIDAKTDAYAEADRRPIAEHLDDYKADLLARGRTPKHAHDTHAIAARLIELARVDRLSAVTSDRIARAIAALRDDGASHRTQEKALRAIKAWSKWLVHTHRVASDPLASLRGSTITERQIVRRALSGDESARLIDAAERGPDWHGLSGPDRAALYRLALGTGFRRGELASLTPADFDLDPDAPTVRVRAAYSKRRRDDVQPIHHDLARWLSPWLAEKPARAPLWTLPRGTAAMLRADLAAARAAWEAEAVTPAERDDRARDPSFLRTPDAAGRRVDLHALRHTFISRVVASGASVKVCQDLARHSTPTLTVGVYAHTRLADLRGALPTVPTHTPARREQAAAIATGTDHATPESAQQPCKQPAQQRARETAHFDASRCDAHPAGDTRADPVRDDAKTLVFSEFCGSTRPETTPHDARGTMFPTHAGVAELADAVDSKSTSGDRVGVRVPPPAFGFLSVGRFSTSRQEHPLAGQPRAERHRRHRKPPAAAQQAVDDPEHRRRGHVPVAGEHVT